jgi:tRNA-modifying protein YgfZ
MSADSNLTTPTARSGPPAPGSRTPRLDGAAALGHWGVIQAQGPEAAHFLHQQLTQDLLLLQAPGARLAAYCSAKGRMLASMVAIKPDADTVLLLLPREVLPATLKRLSMFVLRAKVKLTDATAAFRCWAAWATPCPLHWLATAWPHGRPATRRRPGGAPARFTGP